MLLRDAAATNTVEDVCAALAPVVGPMTKQSYAPEEEEEEDKASFVGHEYNRKSSHDNRTREERRRGRWGWDDGPGRERITSLACLVRVRGMCRRSYSRGMLLDGGASIQRR